MAVPISEVGRRGRLDLTFTSRAGRTAIRHAYCEVPFKITRLHQPRSFGLAHLVVMQCTAGLFGGDTVECAIHVEAGARLLVTQQSATKVHPSRAGIAVQVNRIRVDAGGELHIHYEPVIPFAASRLRQTTSIDVERGATLCFWDSFMAGRIGRGEIWQFEEFASETSLRVGGSLIYLDRFCLSPSHHSPTDDWVMANARYLGTALYFSEGATGIAECLHEKVPGAGVDSPSPNLTVMRSVAADGPEFRRHRNLFMELVQFGHSPIL